MKDEDKLKDIIASGKDAKQWLMHPQYRHVITMIKAELIEEFERTKYKDSSEREEIWRKLQSLNAIIKRMERTARDGDHAEATLLQKIRDRFAGKN